MDTKKSGFWWMKTPHNQSTDSPKQSVVPKLDLKGLNQSPSLTNIAQQDNSARNVDAEVDVGSIIEEINRVAAESPLGSFEKSHGDRSVDDLMKEVEKIYMESSKSFEQLSQRSKTSQNISDLLSSNSKMSTPTPKSVSPLPLDPDDKDEYSSDYSDDFSQDGKLQSGLNSESLSSASSQSSSKTDPLNKPTENTTNLAPQKSSEPEKINSSSSSSQLKTAKSISLAKSSFKLPLKDPATPRESPNISPLKTPTRVVSPLISPKVGLDEKPAKLSHSQSLGLYGMSEDTSRFVELKQEIEIRQKLIKSLEDENSNLKKDVLSLKLEVENTHALIERLKSELTAKTLSSPEINLELEKALEELKDSKEINTALQLQLDTANKTNQHLKSSYDDLLASNKNLDRKVLELDATLAKYKTELLNLQQSKTKLIENEMNLNKLLEIEKLQNKTLKLQNEKDSKCILDLNRQIKEMERIIARKHPDSVSALIVAAKEDATDNNLTARKLLEDRIKVLEQEAANRDSHSSKVFLEIQDKFNQMKNKYESHIEDLELHVSDLKCQLKNRKDTYDVYTQTLSEGKKLSRKETFSLGTQTEGTATTPIVNKTRSAPVGRKIVPEKDSHLLATIRGLQTDLSNKEKVIMKLHKEIDEMRKTNRRLQKEREGSLRNLSDRKDYRSYPEKLASYSRSESAQDLRKDEELQHLRLDRDKLKQQLARLEGDYEKLKKKRLDDLTALQEAHEREVANYIASVTPLREQLELQQVSINTIQTQLSKAKEDLAVATVEKEHLSNRLLNNVTHCGDGGEAEALRKKIAFLENRYEEREYRLRAIVQSLAQKSVTNRSCEQCAERQQQLIGYKVELDQLLATVRALK